MPSNKGVETKNGILRAARELFYKNGYNATTMRQISEASGANLGLLNYYFSGKNEMASIIYTDIRERFDVLMNDSVLRPGTSDAFLFSSALELYLCLNNRPYGRFYNEISRESIIRQMIEEIIANVLMKYSVKKDDPQSGDYVTMACLSIAAIKPSLVSYALNCPEEKKIPTETVLRYYLQQQIHFIGEPLERADFFIELMKHYYIDVVDNFTPVLTPLV